MLGDNLDSRDSSVIEVEKNVYSKTFLWMFLGLIATAIISVFTYTQILNNPSSEIVGFFPIVLIIEVVVVLLFSLLFKKLSPTAVTILFFVYAAVNGVSLSTIFFAYELNSIIAIFFISAAVFLIFALIGKYTTFDLTKIGNIALMALLACIVVSIINLFLGNNFIEYVLDWIILVLFFGITAYDVQKVKYLAEVEVIDKEKIHIYAAMQVYLDFINIFLRILSIFGKRRD